MLNAAADFPERARAKPRERREREGGKKSAGERYLEKGGKNERVETLNVFPLGAHQFPNLTELPWRCPVAERDL